jgi:hypothetical protein
MPMRPDLTTVVKAMAQREAGAALLRPPLVEAGADDGPSVRVRLQDCPTCGAREHQRQWARPFRTGPGTGPLLSMLACETLTARAVLPIVVAAERFPELQHAEFETRGLTWLTVAHLQVDKALEAVDAAERWVADPAEANGRTLPASTRRHRLDGTTWKRHRLDLTPSFLSPHPTVSPSLERQYAEERRATVVANYEQRMR